MCDDSLIGIYINVYVLFVISLLSLFASVVTLLIEICH